jgi:hypothetical protein
MSRAVPQLPGCSRSVKTASKKGWSSVSPRLQMVARHSRRLPDQLVGSSSPRNRSEDTRRRVHADGGLKAGRSEPVQSAGLVELMDGRSLGLIDAMVGEMDKTSLSCSLVRKKRPKT